ncbi:subclass B3 metallo-beta-lactamase [Sphingomonas abietis]|uniref:Subclass B3 metallo-beta-lactamase n=1 Tax=Sphingomonas abietis TaxID=3012344 RepID=A0ABY7NNE7_9SPHN|nr:subclass B3 metallo-beta-lactamase [Sphingomonas abietis]WBO22878.1 subclass B3 metallo-beta-lactamase [Sphingomonas abietis]
MRIHHKFHMGIVATLAAAAAIAPSPARATDPPEWWSPVKPFHIAGPVYYVGTKGLAAYLIRTRSGAILLDGTLASNAPLIERNIESLGVPLHSVRLLISDHAHDDHVGAFARIQRDSGARLLASAGDRWALEHGTPRGDTDYGVRRFGPVRVVGVVADGQTIHWGNVALTAHLTPGHTPGCTSWSMTIREHGVPHQILFLGSITVAGNILVGNHAYPAVVRDYRTTFAKLARMHPDILLTSHPEMAGVLEREVRHEAGDADAFLDPDALRRLVATSQAAFEHALAHASKAAKS